MIEFLLSLDPMWLYLIMGYIILFHVQLGISAIAASLRKEYLLYELELTQTRVMINIFISALLCPFTFPMVMVKYIKMLFNKPIEGDLTDGSETEE